MTKAFFGAAVAAVSMACAAPAMAGTLIGFTDTNPTSDSSIGLGTGQGFLAAGWSQSVAASNVAVSALLYGSGASASVAWWITTAIGPGATASDVVATGTATAPPSLNAADFNSAPFTSLATGLSLAAGDYYLVVLGKAPVASSWNNSEATATLAQGFSLGGSYFGFPAASFAPASPLFPFSQFSYSGLIYEVEGDLTVGVPEPAAWALMLLGFGATGAAIRRRKRVDAATP